MIAFALAIAGIGVLGGYTLDDHQAVLRHPAITGEVAWWEVFVREFWGHALGEQWSSSYRPLTSLSLALEHRITAAPWLHHAVNVLLYAGLCAQVFALARRWLATSEALAAALLFAALPVHVENVASIVGRADILATMAALAAIERAIPRDDAAADVRAGMVAAAWFAIALLCKESLALLPLTIAWLALVAARRRGVLRSPRALARYAVAPAVVGLCGIVYVAWRHRVLPVALPTEFVPADNLLLMREGLARAWGNFAVTGHYLELVAVPLRLCADHTYGDVFPPRSAFDTGALQAWLGLGLVVVLIRDAVRALRGHSPGLGAAALTALLLAGQWTITLSVIVAERLALWPSVWLVLALLHAIAPITARSRRLGVALLALLAARHVQRTLDWRDGIELQSSSLAMCPRAVHSRFILANAMRERGRVDEAIWHYAVAAAGRAAFPEPFESPLLAAEDTLPLSERLPRIPALVGAADPIAYWSAFHSYLVHEHADAEAARVRELAGR